MKKVVIALGVLVLLVGALSACAKPAPSPAPKPAPAPTPAAKPAPTPKPTPARLDIQILTTSFGSQSYLIGTGIAEILNRNSTWIKAAAVETPGSYYNVKTAGDDPAKRKSSMLVCVDDAYFQALEGKAPMYTKKYPDLRAMFFDMALGYAFMSDNPKITTKDDFIGKKIGVGARGSSSGMMPEMIFRDAYEILDKVNMQFLGFNEMRDAFLDKLVDAMLCYSILGGSGKWEPSPTMEEPLIRKDKLYFVGVSAEEVDRLNKKNGWSTAKATVDAGSFGPKQPNAYPHLVLRVGWYCYPELPVEAQYEVMRIIDENWKSLENYHASGKNINRQTFGWLPVASEDYIAPGCLKYFKEKNIPLRLK